MDDFGAVALASGPAEPKVGEPGEKWSRKATLVERVKEVRDKVGQNDSHGQRGQRCRELGVVAHEREGDRPENTHNAGRSKTNLEFPRGVELLCTYPGSWAGSFRGLITPLLRMDHCELRAQLPSGPPGSHGNSLHSHCPSSQRSYLDGRLPGSDARVLVQSSKDRTRLHSVARRCYEKSLTEHPSRGAPGNTLKQVSGVSEVRPALVTGE